MASKELSAAEVCAKLGVSEDTLRRRVRAAGLVQRYVDGRGTEVDPSAGLRGGVVIRRAYNSDELRKLREAGR